MTRGLVRSSVCIEKEVMHGLDTRYWHRMHTVHTHTLKVYHRWYHRPAQKPTKMFQCMITVKHHMLKFVWNAYVYSVGMITVFQFESGFAFSPCKIHVCFLRTFPFSHDNLTDYRALRTSDYAVAVKCRTVLHHCVTCLFT